MLRDYQKNPLGYIQNGSVRKREKPFKEDIFELYIDKNMSVKECAEYFQYNMRMFQKVLAEYSITKDRKQVYEKQKETLLKTKGVENVFQLKEIQEKSKQTSLEKYGVEYYVQTDEYKEKNLETRKEKYGDDPFQRELAKKTIKEKYGVENIVYNHYNEHQLKLLNDREYTEKYIKENNIQSALEFSNKNGFSQAGGEFILSKHNLIDNLICNTTQPEKDIQDLLNGKIEYISHYRMKNNKEIDIFIPKLNMGIEFNGDYWHCEKYKDKKYHQEKSLYANNENIFIYHIFEYEWNEKKQQIINQLNNLLGINVDKIYARKCVIKEVDNKEKIEFLEENHLQGNDQSSIKLGLYYNDELVSLMTFVKPRFNKKYQYELSRFCSKNNCNVIGGASKLFKYFIDNYNPQSIISYSNIAHTKGKLYETLGFNFDSITEPNYVWSNGHKVLSRYQCQKHRLIQEGYEGNTESEIMHNMGYSKLYDCGNKVWVWNKNT
jgi:predicted HTH domain antitoxin